MAPQNKTFLIIFLLFTAHIHHTSAIIINLPKVRNLLSLSHTVLSISTTLLHRVSNLRLSRGDVPGALRAKKLAVTGEYLKGFLFWPTVLYHCWDFYRQLAWVEKDGGYGELLTRSMTELTRVEKDGGYGELLTRVRTNKEWSFGRITHDDLRRLFKSLNLISRFHSVFTKSGALKELMEVLKEEIEEGDLVKDCMEVGSKDLRGLIEILKELSSSYTTYDDDDLLKTIHNG